MNSYYYIVDVSIGDCRIDVLKDCMLLDLTGSIKEYVIMRWISHSIFICPVLSPDAYSFSIGDTSGVSAHEHGGVVTEVKQPEVLTFVSTTK